MNIACINKIEKELSNTEKQIKTAVRCLYKADNISNLSLQDLRNGDTVTTNPPLSENGDYRIVKLLFENFRTYPAHNNKNKYGIDFSIENKPSSLLLIGQNGCGKSTLFSALEQIYSGECTYASTQNVNKELFLTYGFGRDLKHNQQVTDSKWKLHFRINGDNNEHIIPKSDFNPITVPAFFNSTSDTIGFSTKRLSSWILTQMGFGKLDDMLTRISQLIDTNTQSYIRFTQTQHSLLRYEDNDELIKAIILYEDKTEYNEEINDVVDNQNFDINKQHIFFTELWHNLSSQSTKTEEESGFTIDMGEKESQIDVEIQSRLCSLYKILKEAFNKKEELINWKIKTIKELKMEESDFMENQDSSEEITKTRTLLEGIRKKIEDIQNSIVSDFINDNKDFIEDIMSYFSNENEIYKFINHEKENVGNLELKITVGSNGEYETKPNEYFNAFRFNLYVLTLKLTIALHWMKKYEIAAPIVIDDVFNASDFENSINLERYILKVRQHYSDMLKRKEISYPLQLIIMTHDNMVFNSIRNGLIAAKDIDINTKDTCLIYSVFDELYFPFVAGRVFRLDEIDKLSEHTKRKDFINVYI